MFEHKHDTYYTRDYLVGRGNHADEEPMTIDEIGFKPFVMLHIKDPTLLELLEKDIG